ncbi:tRNA (N6-isopentenyl adenosine(37)-C2)-methylthiotransferase MiaB [uncultured Subdoligranulum sp.]|uniref:tRNA (N6-isopentenyl adenosine(37)-C2)-methylthiotransferase MiaB n=1 Tax=uncultured Subdoligranulum sp. TaxID=512298 RepID=UPI0025EBDAF7|nr:tRNA (N6-isopentenyl adenosine(37)-C2)-methylthiotransferase MiaB [uncultured Subdoligranulum sp.]
MEKLTYTHDAAAAAVIAAAYPDAPPMAYVHSFGCQQNVNDGEKICGVLQDVGFGLTDTLEQADLILFNTCAVREHAEQRVFGNVGALKQLKARNPKLVIGVCGCMAQQPRIVDKLRRSYPYVDLVFGVDGIDRLPAMLAERFRKGRRYLEEPRTRNAVVEDLPIRRDSGFRAWLPIMYGCDNFCTYCIVPYVRGRERSREPDAILAEFRSLVQAGYKEITLLGQNVNSYGKGLENPIDFADLLDLLCRVPGDYQIRFMTSHPKDASRKLIDTIAAQPKVCKHIHLPVQCGSDRLLKLMNRHYTVAQYRQLIDYARARIPGVTFSSDIIVGFPGETEEDFLGTLDLVEGVGYMQLFTFIYSRREGTPAADMEDPTPRAEKTARMERLLKVQERHSHAAVAALVGRTVRVLVEGAGRTPGTLNGRLDNNLVVEFPAPESRIGQWARVELTGARAAMLTGRLAED